MWRDSHLFASDASELSEHHVLKNPSFPHDTLFSYTKILHEYSVNIYLSTPSSAPFRDFSSHFNSTLFNYYTFIKYFDTCKTNFSSLFLFFRIFLEILTCLFFLINIWFNLSTSKIICCFHRDQIKFRY